MWPGCMSMSLGSGHATYQYSDGRRTQALWGQDRQIRSGARWAEGDNCTVDVVHMHALRIPVAEYLDDMGLLYEAHARLQVALSTESVILHGESYTMNA